ncbi:MAG: SPASM domain-containing protein [Synergistaceae bacterium]|nr:SPASM domain-containing protein [Synergistaceae bacterium]
MNALDTINNFVDAMLASQTKFADIKAEVDRRNNSVKECISRFRSGVESLTKNAARSSNPDIQGIIQQQTSELEHLLIVIEAGIRATQEGMEFIKKHEDSFNIAVFGKVKSGKSYTGNFIMGNEIREWLRSSYDKIQPPTVTVIDRGKESSRSALAEFEDNESTKVKRDETGASAFVVGPNEATSTIQYFRLGGMLWVDTPGIGSITKENEELAKSFVDSADLIVYMSNFKFAGTKQDFEEMKALHDKKKRFLLLLTRADTVAFGEDENGKTIRRPVPPSDKDRSDMEAYVYGVLKNEGINLDREREFLTISTKLARLGLRDNDGAMFEGSNLKRFLDVLVSITQNEAAKLKIATPSVRINGMIDQFIKTLHETDSKLTEQMKTLGDIRSRLSERNDYLLAQMLNDCMTGITGQVEQKAREVESGGAGMSGDDLQKIVSRGVYSVIMKKCAEEFGKSAESLAGYSDSLKVGNVSGLEMRHDTITWKRQVSERYERAPRGFFEHVGAFFGRTYYGSSTRTVHESKIIDLGVNTTQVLAEVRSSIDSIFREQVPSIMKKFANDSCSLRCEYCSVGDKTHSGMMTESEMTSALLWFAGLARERGEEKPCIIFHGGEPLLIPVRQYRKCLDTLFTQTPDLKFTLNIQTNGTILDGEILSFLKEYAVRPGVSIDGPESVHDSQRRDIFGKATYSRVKANIMTMQAAGLRPSGLMVLTHNSLNAGLEFLKDFAAMNLPLKINPLYSAGEAVNHRELFLKSGEYAEYLIRVFEYVIDNETDISLMPIEYILRGVLENKTPRGCVFSGKCSGSFVCVSHDGNIYPCGRFADEKRHVLGNVHQGGITDSGREILCRLRASRTVNLREECVRCKYLTFCSGGCIAHNGAMCADFVKFMDYLYGEGLRKYKTYLLMKREEILRRLDNAV